MNRMDYIELCIVIPGYQDSNVNSIYLFSRLSNYHLDQIPNATSTISSYRRPLIVGLERSRELSIIVNLGAARMPKFIPCIIRAKLSTNHK
jgi:hypothetical protein